MTQDWNAVMDAVEREAFAKGLKFHEVRNEVARLKIEEDQEFYEGHGVGSSDMNHMLYGEWKSDPDGVRRVIKDLAERNKLRSYLEAQGVDLQAAAKMFEPI